MHLRSLPILSTLAAVLALAGVASAQDAQVPPPVYSGDVGGGFALTGGNTDTKNFNLGATLERDAQTRNVIRGSISYLRGEESGVLNLNRTAFTLRDEYTLSGRAFVFGKVNYLRDQFKEIIFLWAPGAGIGYKLVDTDATQFVLDGGAGTVLEKNPGLAAEWSGSITAGESFEHELTASSKLTQTLDVLWKTDDFADSLTNFSIGVTTTLVGNLELKVEFIDSYKNKPANPLLEKNDTAFVTAFVWKFPDAP